MNSTYYGLLFIIVALAVAYFYGRVPKSGKLLKLPTPRYNLLMGDLLRSTDDKDYRRAVDAIAHELWVMESNLALFTLRSPHKATALIATYSDLQMAYDMLKLWQKTDLLYPDHEARYGILGRDKVIARLEAL